MHVRRVSSTVTFYNHSSEYEDIPIIQCIWDVYFEYIVLSCEKEILREKWPNMYSVLIFSYFQ